MAQEELNLTGYKLTFDDEFNTRSISQSGAGTTWSDIRSEWRYDANSDIGFGRSSFVDSASGYDPFRVEGGALTITAAPDRTASGYAGSWESGLITTQHTFSQTYGYYEIRADFSDRPGAWDAFWLVSVAAPPTPSGAGWQELDVVEHYGGWDRGVYSTIHTTDPQNGVAWQENRQVYSELTSSAGFHTYGMDWEKDTIKFYVDGKFVGSQATPSDMHGPMYLIANLATQSRSDNDVDAGSGTPISSKIDYIRVYSAEAAAHGIAQQSASSPDGQDSGSYGASHAEVSAVTPAAVSSSSPPLTPSGSAVSAPGEHRDGGAGDNLLQGGAGGDTIRGLGGNDTIDAGEGNDDANGNTGSDVLHGGAGADTLRGGQGDDYVYGDDGDDGHLNGNLGDDHVFGGSGDDTVFGGQGFDTLYGGVGNDVMSGDLGDDSLMGGAGADRFVFRSGAGLDVIGDFNAAEGDRVQLSLGAHFTIESGGVISLSGGDRIVLVGVPMVQSDWIVFA